MKAEHRKELQTNFLADRMGRLMQGMKAGPQSSGSVVIWFLAALTIGTIIAWYVASANSNRSPLWVRFEEDSSSEKNFDDLKRLADDNPGTLPARAARFQYARVLLQIGLANLYSGREGTVSQLKQARQLYGDLAQECTDDLILAPQALMGAAKAEEALAGIPKGDDSAEGLGSVDKALEYYHRLTKDYPNSFLAKAAQERIDNLEKSRDDADKFYQEMRKLVAENQKK
jgi:hypothetical protein